MSSGARGTSSLAWHSNLLCPLLPRVAMDKRRCPSGSPVFIFEMGQSWGTCPAHLPQQYLTLEGTDH